MNVILQFLLLAIGLNVVYALSTPVYDCDSNNLSVTTFSLINLGKCGSPRYNKITSKNVHIQLLEVKDIFFETDVIKCKVEVNRTVYYCGNSLSRNDIVANNTAKYIHEVSYDTCKYMHETRFLNTTLNTKPIIIEDVQINNATQRRLFLAGSFSDVECRASNYSDPYGTWLNVVVLGYLNISIERYSVPVSPTKNEIILQSNTVCRLSNENCIDLYDGSQTFWKSIPSISKSQDYNLLYNAKALELKYENNDFPIVYVFFHENIIMTMITNNYESFSSYSILRTQHSRLIIKKVHSDSTLFDLKVYSSRISHYINSKTFFMKNRQEKFDVISVYQNALEFYCNKEHQTMNNYFNMASRYRNDVFSYNFMKVPGYTAIFSGDVLHIRKCILIEVELTENTDKCFAELQVQLRNKTYYMMPFTRILNSHGNRIPCNSTTPPHYFVGGKWIKMLPLPSETPVPKSFTPLTNKRKIAFEFQNRAVPYSSSSSSEKNDYVTKETISDVENKITMLIKNLTSYKKYMENMLWLYNPIILNILITVGSYGSSFIYSCIIGLVTIISVTMIIRGYTLYSVFGRSLKLLGAVLCSITLYLLQREKLFRKQQQPEAKTQESIQMQAFNDKLNANPSVYSIPELEKEKLKIDESTAFQNNQAHFDDYEEIYCSPANYIDNNLYDYPTMTNNKLNHQFELTNGKIVLGRDFFKIDAYLINNFEEFENVILENNKKQCYPLPLILKTGSNSYVSLVINKSNIGILANSLGRGIKFSEQINLIINNYDIQIVDVSVQQNNEDFLVNVLWAFNNTKQILEQIDIVNEESIELKTTLPQYDSTLENFKHLVLEYCNKI